LDVSLDTRSPLNLARVPLKTDSASMEIREVVATPARNGRGRLVFQATLPLIASWFDNDPTMDERAAQRGAPRSQADAAAGSTARRKAARAMRRVESSVGSGEFVSFMISGISVQPRMTASQPSSFMRDITS
jgi:hypothetical protein